MTLDTRMFREAAAAPDAVRRQLHANRDLVEQLGEVVRNMAPRAVVTCARGSSDHAATFAKYLIETRTGLLASSAAPSISSVYASKADLEGVLFIAISQSGASPDLLAAAGSARDAGALVVALVNAEDSPLARIAHHTVPLRAGVEASVAATKSYIASLAAIVHLVARWTQDHELKAALEQAPDQLELAWQLDWGAAIEHLRPAGSLYRRRSRARSGYRAGGRAQVEGDLRAARRGVQRRRSAPRSDGAGAQRLSDPRVRTA